MAESQIGHLREELAVFLVVGDDILLRNLDALVDLFSVVGLDQHPPLDDIERPSDLPARLIAALHRSLVQHLLFHHPVEKLDETLGRAVLLSRVRRQLVQSCHQLRSGDGLSTHARQHLTLPTRPASGHERERHQQKSGQHSES